MILESFCKHIFRIIQLVIILQFSIAIVTSKDDQAFVGFVCTPSESGTYTENSEFQKNLNDTLLTHLVANASSLSFSSITMGEASDQVNALYYCRGDVRLNECHNCVSTAATTIINYCKMLKQGMIYYDQCTLGYSDRSIFSSTQEYLALSRSKYNHTSDLGDYLNQYQTIFDNTMNKLKDQAATNASLRPQGFATGLVNLSAVQSLRGIVQCAPIIKGTSCQSCLKVALSQIQGWTVTFEFLPSCFVGFELYGSRPSVPPTSSSSGLQVGYKVVLAVVSICIVLSLLGGFWYYLKCRSRKDPSVTKDIVEQNESWKQNKLAQYTYFEVEEMTNGFANIIGEGGFAVVYHGWLPDNNNLEIAVKVFSKTEAPKQFSTEIEVLGQISHKNLVSLIGYCEEGANLALIYEFMARGDLKSFLSEHSDGLNWKKRVEIAIDAAQGLDYLHNGCSPPIVHRDVKPANILLNKKLRAKVADFGVSKIFPADSISNLLTRVVGTPGYLDPLYSFEKGDVYSFGVVLLQLITGRKAILHNNINLVSWVRSLLERGDIESILDTKLSQDVDDNYGTVWKAVDLAVRCGEFEAAERPTMAQVVMELKECLSIISGMSSSSATNCTERMSAAALSSTLLSPSPC